jgi:hypothetical protein
MRGTSARRRPGCPACCKYSRTARTRGSRVSLPPLDSSHLLSRATALLVSAAVPSKRGSVLERCAGHATALRGTPRNRRIAPTIRPGTKPFSDLATITTSEPRPSASNFWPRRETFVIAPTVRRPRAMRTCSLNAIPKYHRFSLSETVLPHPAKRHLCELVGAQEGHRADHDVEGDVQPVQLVVASTRSKARRRQYSCTVRTTLMVSLAVRVSSSPST